jgi:hypothetical protein
MGSQYFPENPLELKCVDFIEYVLDIDNNIIAIQGSWDAFAYDNNATEISATQVIGKPLLRYVSGNVTRQFWTDVFLKARNAFSPVSLDYRCDSPSLRRFMNLSVTVDNEVEGRLRLRSTCLRIEERDTPVIIERARERSRETSTRCSVCNKILCRDQWTEADDLNSSNSKVLQVVYGVCSNCKSILSNFNQENLHNLDIKIRIT